MDRIDRFREAWRGLGALTEPEPVLEEIERRWSEPVRRYHTLEHLDFLLAELAGVQDWLDRPHTVTFAAFTHDVIYDPRATDNETRSVEWALDALEAAGVDPAVRERVAWLILATAHEAVPEEDDGRFLVDADLAILGQPPERFDRYEQQVREEYAHVPAILYRRGRAKVLARFLGRPSLYLTDTFRQRYEEQARKNLEASLARLTSFRGRWGL